MIEAHELTKKFGDVTIVEDISFRCEPGTITGFLGPNGAGKSTTMRMLVGLARPTSGSSEICGQSFTQLANPGRRVGILLDASALHPGRTGRETLVLGAQMMGIDSPDIDALLDLVGLAPSAARKRVGRYSLGMRQRLGIAHALLGDPSVLILDEPANGLDPDGMRWMREVLREFADAGGTVLLSSHLLNEVQAVADQLVFIGSGRIVAAGAPDALLASDETSMSSSDDARMAIALDAVGIAHRPLATGGMAVAAPSHAIGQIALDERVVLHHLAPTDGAGLEQLFFDLTSTAAPIAAGAHS